MNNPDTDLESVRHEYRAQLAELTFNSKPIITNLTIIAQENIHVARAIVQAIEDQIKASLPPQKLPVLYLLDSISKNVGGVYITLFSHNLLHTFIDAYHAVDDTTKQKFERVLNTWKVGPNGGPVYPPEVTGLIERALIKQQQIRYQNRGSIDGRNHIHINPNFLAGMYGSETAPLVAQLPLQQSQVFMPPPDQTRLIQEYRALLLQRQQYALQNAGDPNNQVQIQTLQGLLDIIQMTTLTPDQIQQLRQQISSYMSPSQQPHAATTSYGNLPTTTTTADLNALLAQHGALQHNISTSATAASTSSSTNTPPTATSAPLYPSQPLNLTQSSLPHTASSSSSIGLQSSVNSLVSDPNALVRNLMDFGLLGSKAAGAGGVVGGTPTTPPIVVTVTGSTLIKELGKIQLTSSDIQKKRDGAIAILYDAYPLQCKQCGFRYAKTEEGKAKMDAHLDWHFRQNRRMKDKAKTAQSRNWFVTEEDWIYSRESEINTIIQSAAYFEPAPSTSEEEVMNESTVIVPLDWEKISKPCPICQEKFKKYYSDADDEWIFKNAVEIGGVIYHASCYADVIKNQETAQSSSRESTPSTVLGKRKAEESQPEVLEVQKRPALVS
ncbi:418_t:CDS:10 [Ambispora leptoticha]|uniref:418_t:CDS:1 n=1 Tax=Ambispora leptoticha TaxID=144679 RepID=A0A9N9CJ67_9GLOM|nr:418_t:CDS:10 [Ambispora leptoticha]